MAWRFMVAMGRRIRLVAASALVVGITLLGLVMLPAKPASAVPISGCVIVEVYDPVLDWFYLVQVCHIP